MKQTVLLLVLFLCLPVWGLTEVPKTVDPDNGGGTDYTSLDAWEDALGGTTSGHLPNDDQIAIAECRSSGGTADTTPVVISGWTTDATHYIKVTGSEGDGDFPADGIYDGTKYVFHNNDSDTYGVQCNEDYVRFENIQFLVTTSGTNARVGIYITLVGTADIRFNGCIFKGICSGTGQGFGLYLTDASSTVSVFNSVFTGFISGADINFWGILITNVANAYIYNCIFYNNYTGIRRSSGTVDVINCALFNNTDDLSGTFNLVDNCGTEQGAGEGDNDCFTITQTADDYAALVVDAAGDDFSVKNASSELYNTGNGATPKSTFTVDIIGTTRGPADLDWDVGAFELITVAPTGGQVIMITSLPILFIGLYICRKYKAA